MKKTNYFPRTYPEKDRTGCKVSSKKAFNMVEISIVISLLFITILACVPTIFNNTRQAKIISGWKQLFAETKSNFEIFSINDFQAVETVCKSEIEDKDKAVLQIVSPYLNINNDADTKPLKNYMYRYSNGAQVPMQSGYFAKNFSFQDSGTIVGFKLLNCKCSEAEPCAAAIFDMNGLKKPNRLGQDVFGIHIYKKGIKPFGDGLSNKELERNCVKGRGSGASCSEFYLRGGKF